MSPIFISGLPLVRSINEESLTISVGSMEESLELRPASTLP
jgi:hypothetical protein